MGIELNIEAGSWDEASLLALSEAALVAVCARLQLDPQTEVSVLACDDTRIAVLNGEFRGKAGPTNVLSWPSDERGAAVAGDLPTAPADPEIGDIALAHETIAAEARAQGKSFDAHLSHLLVHGILHLLGFDHENEEDAALMESFEVEILDTLGVPDPYQE